MAHACGSYNDADHAVAAILVRALWCDPSLAKRTVQHIISTPFTMGFIGVGREVADRRAAIAGHGTAEIQPGNATQFMLEDATTLLSDRTLLAAFGQNAPAEIAQANPYLSVMELVRRRLVLLHGEEKTGDAPWIIPFSKIKYNDLPNGAIMPEIITTVLEFLQPRLNVRFTTAGTATANASPQMQGETYISWWGHSFLSIPLSVFKGSVLLHEALTRVRTRPEAVFSNCGVPSPFGGFPAVEMFNAFKYNDHPCILEAYDSWYWIIHYLCELAYAVASETTEWREAWCHVKWFMHAVSVIKFWCTGDVDFLNKDAILFNATPSSELRVACLLAPDSFVDEMCRVTAASFPYSQQEDAVANVKGMDPLLVGPSKEIIQFARTDWPMRAFTDQWRKNVLMPLTRAAIQVSEKAMKMWRTGHGQ